MADESGLIVGTGWLRKVIATSSVIYAWVKYLHAMKESIHVYVDDAEELRADHVLKLWGATFLKLHYRMRLVSPTQQIAPHAADRE